MFIAYVDMEKAFDRVPRGKIWEALRKIGANEKLVRICQCIYQETRNVVTSKNKMSKEFITKQGVRQGGSLSPLLFIIYMDQIMTEVNRRTTPVKIGYRNMKQIKIQQCAFADDVAIIASRQEELRDKLNVWKEVLEKHGMKMNLNKTKVMAISHKSVNMKIKLDGSEIEQVKQYKYLGVIIQETGEQDEEIRNRINNTNKLFYSLNKYIIGKKEITQSTKMKVYKAIYRPVLTYGCEIWVANERQRNRIRAVEMKYLRRAYGVTLMDKIRSVKIREDLGVKSMEEYIEERQLGWWGHVQRMGKTTQVKEVYEAKMQGKRGRGRPRKTWDDSINTIIEKRGIKKEEAVRLAKDRKTWKEIVRG